MIAVVDTTDLLLAIAGTMVLAVLIFLIWYAYYRAFKDSNTSISKIIARWGQRVGFLPHIITAIVAFIIGLLFGHWFWPVHLEDYSYYHQCPSCRTWYYTDDYEQSTREVFSKGRAFYRPITPLKDGRKDD